MLPVDLACEQCGAASGAGAHQTADLLRTVIDESPDIISVKDWHGRFLLGNRALARLYGTTPDDLIGKDDGAFNPDAEQVAFSLDNVQAVMRSGVTQVVLEESTDVETGETHYFQSIKKPLLGPGGEPWILVIAHEVTDLKRAHRVIEERERSYDYAMAAAGEGIWDWDLERNVVTHNMRWCQMLGLDASRLQHPIETFTEHLHEDDRDEVAEALEAAVAGGGHYLHEHRMRRQDGSILWVHDRGRVVERDSQGRPTRMSGAMSDVTDRVRYEQELLAVREALVKANIRLESEVRARTAELARANAELARANAELKVLARRDPLTGLPNRLAGTERLESEFVRLGRTDEGYAILMIDVDLFKPINDRFGHPVGDQVLRHVAEVVAGALRESDSVARFGGEEFMVVLPATDLDGAVHAAEKIRAAVSDSTAPVVGRVTISIGVAMADRGQVSADAAVRNADAALYRAKANGRDRVEAWVAGA